MSREDNIKVFQDTERLVKINETLAKAIKKSRDSQIMIPDYMQVSDYMVCEVGAYEQDAAIVVSKKRTLEAASAYTGKRVCVHNFASAMNPGGGVTKGSSAQEECLCRCSTLYFNLNISDMWNCFYSPHRNMQNPLHNDDCIYTPSVVVMKTDTSFPKIMKENEWYEVNVITCAAPNLREKPTNQMNSGEGDVSVKISDDALYDLHVKRLTRVMEVAKAGGNEVVILGAFGCGAFENNPEIVAKASKKVAEMFIRDFETIEFAVYCSDVEEYNYHIFEKIIN